MFHKKVVINLFQMMLKSFTKKWYYNILPGIWSQDPKTTQ